jgi:enoyl-CoA hydratase/carnithine racemase
MPLVTFQRTDHLGEIVIDRPPQNLFNGDLLTDLRSAVDDAASSDVRAVLVRAEGDDFSAGADVDVFIASTRPRPRSSRPLSSRSSALLKASRSRQSR